MNYKAPFMVNTKTTHFPKMSYGSSEVYLCREKVLNSLASTVTEVAGVGLQKHGDQ